VIKILVSIKIKNNLKISDEHPKLLTIKTYAVICVDSFAHSKLIYLSNGLKWQNILFGIWFNLNTKKYTKIDNYLFEKVANESIYLTNNKELYMEHKQINELKILHTENIKFLMESDELFKNSINKGLNFLFLN
jgi:hypothetical protein